MFLSFSIFSPWPFFLDIFSESMLRGCKFSVLSHKLDAISDPQAPVNLFADDALWIWVETRCRCWVEDCWGYWTKTGLLVASQPESPTFHRLFDRGAGEIFKTSFPGVSAREPAYSTLLGAELVVVSIVLA